MRSASKFGLFGKQRFSTGVELLPHFRKKKYSGEKRPCKNKNKTNYTFITLKTNKNCTIWLFGGFSALWRKPLSFHRAVCRTNPAPHRKCGKLTNKPRLSSQSSASFALIRAPNQTRYATLEVSMCWISVRMNAISLRAFSRMTLGSCDWHRSRFGANTIARLDESIFVLATTSGRANCCRKCTR